MKGKKFKFFEFFLSYLIKMNPSPLCANHSYLFSSPSSKIVRTPETSPFSRSILNILSPIHTSPHRCSHILTPINLSESLNLLSPIGSTKNPTKSFKKIDFSASKTVKFSSILAKISIAQDLESQNLPLKRPKKSRKQTNSTENICCNCQKSRCLKLYCECFAAGVYCEKCNCTECLNTQTHENHRKNAMASTLDRNPNAFKPKIKMINFKGEIKNMHGKGCHCSKSGCLKKYCECFQSGVVCNENCQCLGCKNSEFLIEQENIENFQRK